MGNALKKYEERYTVAERETWNDPWELIYGMPYCMSPAPGYRHQKLNSLILAQCIFALQDCRHCEALMPIDWEIDAETVVQPDLLILCEPVEGPRLRKPPVCIFEILSPSTRKKDRTIKFDVYQAQKVRYYVLVDPDTNSHEVYQLNSDDRYVLLEPDPKILLDLGDCVIRVDMQQIWEA